MEIGKMGLTNFTNGITSFGVPVYGGAGGAVPGFPIFTGDVYFVSSLFGAAGNAGTSAEYPYASLVTALASATAQSSTYGGDVIIVMPGHAEAISSATGMAISKKGVTILGMGAGNARPTFTLDTANTATIAVSAANVTIDNCIFVANFLSIAAAFTLTTAAAFTLSNCEFRETSSVLDFLYIVKSTGAANTVDDLKVVGCTWNGLGTTSVNSFILTANDIDNAQVIGNTVILARTADASILITVSAGVLTNLNCGYNNVQSQQTATTAGSLINVGGTTSSGIVQRNFAQTLTTAADKLYTTTVGLAAFENYVSGAIGASGFIIPARDT
jgi:hypothetical protein